MKNISKQSLINTYTRALMSKAGYIPPKMSIRDRWNEYLRDSHRLRYISNRAHIDIIGDSTPVVLSADGFFVTVLHSATTYNMTQNDDVIIGSAISASSSNSILVTYGYPSQQYLTLTSTSWTA